MKMCFPHMLVLFLFFLLGVGQGVENVRAQEKTLSDEAEILLLGARNALKAGYLDKALRRYQTFVERYPGIVEGHQELGWLLIEQGKREEGLAQLKRGGLDTRDLVTAQVQTVDILLQERRFQEAYREIERLLEETPNDKTVQVKLANYYVHRRRLPQAQRLYETLLGTSVDKESRMGLVNVALARGNLESATYYLADLHQQFPQDPYIQKQQVLLWGREGRIGSAYRGLAQMTLEPLRKLTEAELLNVTGQYYSAESQFSELVAEQPGHYAAMMGLAYAYVGQHDDAKAAEALHSVLEKFPEDLEARLALVEILTYQRRWEAGREMLSPVLQEEPDVLEAIYLDYQLNDRVLSSGKGRISPSARHWWNDTIHDSEEAIRAKQQLARFEDLHGIREVSAPFLREAPLSTSLLSQWTRAMIVTGRSPEGLKRLQSHQEQSSQDVRLSRATFHAHEGEDSDAMALLEEVSPIAEKGHLYQQLGEWEQAEQTFSAIIQKDAEHTRAHIGRITSLAMIGEESTAQDALQQLFEECPERGWPALAGLLVYAEGSSSSYQSMLQIEFNARGLDDEPASLDTRLRYLALLSQQEEYADVVQQYQALNRDNPQRPDLVLGLARSLSQYQNSQAMHESQPVVEAYDHYLALKPYDVAVWTEKARYLGWQSKYSEAEREYEAILAQYPHEDVVRLELEGKQKFWRRHDRMAYQRYREVLELRPQHEEALSDLGQIHSAAFRFEDARPYYRRLLTGNPGHRLVSESLELTNIFARPQITAGIGYVKMDGFDGSVLTKYMPVTAEVFAPFSQDFWAGVGYQWVKFDVPGKPSSANIGRVMARYSPSPFWHIDGYAGGLKYSGTSKSNVNFGAGVSYEWQSGLKGRIETGRKDLWQNAETIRRNLSYHSYVVGAEYNVTKELELTAGAGFWDYSDDNWNVNGQFSGTYSLLPFPHPLRVTYQLDTFGFDKKSVYFSPEFFAKNTFAIGWQHFLGFPRRKEHHGESPMRNRYSGTDIGQYLGWPIRPVYVPKTALNAYSLDYGFSVDDENNLYHQVSASFAYAITKRCHLHAVGRIIRADVVDQDSVNGFLQCHL